MPMTSTEMIKLLLKNGFKQVPGGKGSHKKFFNQSTGKYTVVPDHKQELGKGLEYKILKQARLILALLVLQLKELKTVNKIM